MSTSAHKLFSFIAPYSGYLINVMSLLPRVYGCNFVQVIP